MVTARALLACAIQSDPLLLLMIFLTASRPCVGIIIMITKKGLFDEEVGCGNPLWFHTAGEERWSIAWGHPTCGASPRLVWFRAVLAVLIGCFVSLSSSFLFKSSFVMLLWTR